MSYQSGVNVSPVFLTATVAELRAAASPLFKAGALANVVGIYAETGTPLFWWDPTSLATDDGITIIKPNDIAGGSPGRWTVTPFRGGTPNATPETIMSRDGNADTAVRYLAAEAVIGGSILEVYATDSVELESVGASSFVQLKGGGTSGSVRFRARELRDLDVTTGAKRVERHRFAVVQTIGAVQSEIGRHFPDISGGRVKRTVTARRPSTGERASWVYHYDARLLSGTARWTNPEHAFGIPRAIKDIGMMDAQCELSLVTTGVRVFGTGFTGATIDWYDELEGVV